jgi:hypothetical protein
VDPSHPLEKGNLTQSREKEPSKTKGEQKTRYPPEPDKAPTIEPLFPLLVITRDKEKKGTFFLPDNPDKKEKKGYKSQDPGEQNPPGGGKRVRSLSTSACGEKGLKEETKEKEEGKINGIGRSRSRRIPGKGKGRMTEDLKGEKTKKEEGRGSHWIVSAQR